ncbi:MAG TPA: YraN family protein [Lentisphaeria bacterium]|nr:YraN family protein [Lentisphaeria bacterium]
MRLRDWSSMIDRWVRRWRLTPGRRFARRRAAHLRLGRRGELVASRILAELGMDILCRNYRCSHGEVDIVARDGAVLCFVEVKTRQASRWPGRPADAVDRSKRLRLARTARQYLRRLTEPDIAHRFDIVEVVYAGRNLAKVTHLPDAFPETSGRRQDDRTAQRI